jgi:sigma-B regulation protein RsbU (phosphoserine phosphatase)
VYYPQQAAEEGLASMLCVGIIYQAQPIGTLQMYTAETRRFTQFEVDLVRAIAQLLATAIEKTRLDAARIENQQMLRQLHLAADVQRRMLPRRMPTIPGYEIAARYVPSFELSGDFYDFVALDHSIGIGIGDVVGKGVAASLLMAGVRASLRAFAQDVYDLDEVIARVNVTMCRDTLDSEFATLWYGTLNPDTRRLTYCNAGHEPPLVVRDGQLIPLDIGGMIVGVDRGSQYIKGIWDFKPGDLILFYTDGLPDAMNDRDERFGRARVEKLLLEVASRSANDALNHILWTVRQYTGPRRATDDTTLIVLKAL